MQVLKNMDALYGAARWLTGGMDVGQAMGTSIGAYWKGTDAAGMVLDPKVSMLDFGGWVGGMALAYATGGLGGVVADAYADVWGSAAGNKYGYSKSLNEAGGYTWKSKGMFTGPLVRRFGGNLAVHGFRAATIGGGAAIAGPVGAAAGWIAGTALSPRAAMVGAAISPVALPVALGTLGVAAAGYAAYSGGKALADAGYRHAQTKKAIHTSGDLSAFTTRRAATMRQRALVNMNRSVNNARSALGQEAAILSRPWLSPYGYGRRM